jgi:hypothetical protein
MKMREPVVHALVYGDIQGYADQSTLAERSEGFKKAFAAFEGAIPETRRMLEEEFRTMLGVSHD